MTFNTIQQFALIENDEEGSTAVAATTTGAGDHTRIKFIQRKLDEASGHRNSNQFNSDHPFVYVIHDQISKEILFAGIYRRSNK